MLVQVRFGGVEYDARVEKTITEKATKLAKLHGRISRCEVMVESLSNRHSKGDPVRIRIHLTVPGGEIVVGDQGEDPAHEDMRAAIRDAFDAAKRQLRSYSEKRRGEVKQHDAES